MGVTLRSILWTSRLAFTAKSWSTFLFLFFNSIHGIQSYTVFFASFQLLAENLTFIEFFFLKHRLQFILRFKDGFLRSLNRNFSSGIGEISTTNCVPFIGGIREMHVMGKTVLRSQTKVLGIRYADCTNTTQASGCV